jgi:cysteine-rich repeat protein
MGPIRLLFACLLAGCLSSGSTFCADGRVCPEGTVCATVADTPRCVSPDQLARCEGIEPFGACGDSERCYDGVCLAGGCGNSILDPEETCDDGNLRAGDTCSAVCLEEKCGNGAIDVVLGEECDDGVAGISGDGCSSTCKLEVLAWRDISPTPIGARYGATAVYDAARGVTVAFGGLGANATYGDTWIWDRATWTKLNPPASPPARYLQGMAYDPVRKRVVMFGGNGIGNSMINDTWEWDGVTWTEMHPTTVPQAISNAQLAFDADRGKVMLVDYADTYAWDGTDWTIVGAAPQGFFTHPLGYDAVNHQLLTCGFKGDNTCHTFVLNGSTWSEITTATTRPYAVNGERMAWDATRNKLVLFGGGGQGPGSQPVLNEIWEWNGTNWVLANPQPRPSPRDNMVVAYDGAAIVIYGGNLGLQITASDTWTWNGTIWSPQTPPVGPAARSDAVMASDPHGGALMFGGSGDTPFIETWQWGPSGWRRIVTSTYPVVYQGASMTFDLARQRYVLFGGSDGTKRNDTWEFGSTWQKMTPTGDPALPAARSFAAMAFDAERGVSVMFGGFVGSSTVAETWTYDGSTWKQMTPTTSPAAGAYKAMAYDPERKRIVMFGGTTLDPSAASETWEWDGADWSLIPTTNAPATRQGATLVYHPILHGLVMYGGRHGNSGEIYGEAWLWNGTTWRELPAGNTPDPRFIQVSIYDSLRRGLLVFGGRLNTTYSPQTLLLDYRGIVAAESCGFANVDTDGDGLEGCSDPDCAGRCASCGDGTCSLNEDYLICPSDCVQ